jgi:hypothetical protein
MKRQTVPGIQISGVCLLLLLLVPGSLGCSKYKPAGPADEPSKKGAAPAELPKNQEERGA